MDQKERTVSHQMEMQSATPETVTQIAHGMSCARLSSDWGLGSIIFLRRKPPFKHGRHRKAVPSRFWHHGLALHDHHVPWAIETLVIGFL